MENASILSSCKAFSPFLSLLETEQRALGMPSKNFTTRPHLQPHIHFLNVENIKLVDEVQANFLPSMC